MRRNRSYQTRVLRILVVCLLAVAATGCGKGNAYILVPQHWNNTEFVVEIRPGAPTRGMNEFVVVATDRDGVPGYQYVVSIKMASDNQWVQMIQDGHSGVYRRAIAVHDPANDILDMQVKHSDKDLQTVLQYPLTKHVK
ncbi:MAG: hypothetical protein PVJ39_06300 [Gammaproteobacteria bacterium]|jgi:hypothetical protein